MAGDPVFAAAIIEASKVQHVSDPDDLGMTATMRGKIVASERWAVATETRRRLNRALLAQGIELNKRGVVRASRRNDPVPDDLDDDGDGGADGDEQP